MLHTAQKHASHVFILGSLVSKRGMTKFFLPVGSTCFRVQVLQNEVQLHAQSLHRRTVGLCETKACFLANRGKKQNTQLHHMGVNLRKEIKGK